MPLTIEQFTQRLTSSGVMSEDELRDWLMAVPTEKRPGDGETLARELVKQKKLTKFQAEQIYAGKEKSLTLGNYLLLDKLGQGGMGMVLKARHRRMGRVVALKVMSPAAVKSADAVKRFHREVQTAAKLIHPNIVTAFDADEAKGTHFLVMEYVEGDDLSQLVKKHGALSVEQTIECILQAARGLAHAHQEGVVHRDIKPANLLLDKNGTVKILDMGLARLDSGLSDAAGVEGAGLTQSGTIMGTVDYMSPEQAEDTRHADARSDIYSLGCSLFYLLTGHVVYGGETMMKKLLAHRDAPIPSLRSPVAPRQGFNAGDGRQSSDAQSRSESEPRSDSAAWNALDSVFRKMVAKKPSDRQQSMTEVIGDLERCRSGEGVTVNVVKVSGESGSSYELQNFLRQISGEEGISATSAGTVGTSTTPVDMTAETMLLTNNSAGTDPQTEMTLAYERSRKAGGQHDAPASGFSAITTRSRVVLAAAAVVALLLGGVWLFRTPRGVMQIEITDEQAEVTLGETGRVLRGSINEAVKLPIGEHVLHVAVGETKFDTPEITVAKGEPVAIKVERNGNRVRVMRGKEFLVAKELPRAKSNGSKSGNATEPAMMAPEYALEFDGKSSHVELPNVGLTLFKPFTVEAWVRLGKPADPADDAILFVGSGMNLSRAARGPWLFHGGQQKGQNVRIESNKVAAVEEWVHVAAVSDGQLRSLFVNGQRQKETKKNEPPRDTTTEIVLGALPRTGRLGGGKHLSGQLREVRLSKVARYQSDFQPAQRFASDKETLALYHCDEGSGDVLKDSSANKHHGKIVAAKWVRPTSASEPDYALHFDGDDVVTVDRLPAYSTDSLTIEAVVRADSAKTDSWIYGLGSNGGLGTYRIEGQWRHAVVLDPVGWFQLVSPEPARLQQRVHVAGVCDKNEFRLYVDGKLSGLPGSSVGAMFRPRQGNATIGYGFRGMIDELRVSKIARYWQDFTPPARHEPDANTFALYHFNEGVGDVLKDSSGNKHHGMIDGAKWVKAESQSEPSVVKPPLNMIDMANWNVTPNRGHWTIKDGVLVGTAVVGRQGLTPFVRSGFKNFQLHAEVRFQGSGNGGFYFDSSDIKTYSYHVEISPSNSEPSTGSLAQAGNWKWLDTKRHSLAPDGEWFQLDVLADGPLLEAKVNGQAIASLSNAAPDQTKTLSLELDGRTGPVVIEFRKLEIRELSEAVADQPGASNTVDDATFVNGLRVPVGAPLPAKAPFDDKQARANQRAWAEHLGTTVETTNSVGAKMILIPPGEFLMGSTDEQIEAAVKIADEK